MLMRIFTVYDCKAEAYLPPFYNQSRGSALRSFSDTVNDQNSLIAKHSADFTLFELGAWDDQDAEFTPHQTKINLGTGIEFLEPPGPAAPLMET